MEVYWLLTLMYTGGLEQW